MAFTWVYVVVVAFHFASSAFTVPLCFGVYAAFAALAFRILCVNSSSAQVSHPLLSQLVFWALASCTLSSSSLVPLATIKMHP